MNEDLHRSLSGARWRGRILGMIVLLVIALSLFRPLLWNDYQQIRSASVGVERHQVLVNAASDVLCLVMVVAALFGLVITRIGAIALNTFREAVRNRILYFILFFALILMGASVAIRQLVNLEQERFITHIGLTSISFFGLMVAIFVGISLVYNELERKTIYTIVSKPIHRYQFLLGKYFGLLLTVYVIVGVMTFFFFTLVNYQQIASDDAIASVIYKMDQNGEEVLVENAAWLKTGFLIKAAGVALLRGTANLFGFPSGTVTENIMIVIAMFCLELMIVTAFAILYSSFSTPTLSAVFTVLTFLAGRLNEDIMRLAERIVGKAMHAQNVSVVGDLAWATQAKAYIAEIAALLVPNLDSLNVMSKALYQETMEVWRYPVLYALCYTGCVLLLSVVIFRKRNFK